MHKKIMMGLLIGALALLMMTAPIQAQVADRDSVSGISDVVGSIARIELAPSSVMEGSPLEDDFRAFVFIERENRTLSSPLDVDVVNSGTFGSTNRTRSDTILSGTEINSYFIAYDPSGLLVGFPGISGTIIFQQDVLGLIIDPSTLQSTNSRLGASRTDYGTFQGISFTQESVSISSDRRSVSFQFENNSQLKQIRVITFETESREDFRTAFGDDAGDGDGDGSGNCNNPDANDDSESTTINRAVEINVLDNDDDDNNNTDDCTISIESQPSDGSVSVSNSEETITYTPDNGFVGTDSFEYEICDDDNDCSQATVRVTVRSGTAGGDNGSGDGGSAVSMRTLLPEADDCSHYEEARIDVVPGNRENIVRLDDEEGNTPVAILSTEFFSAPNCVDVSTITFGPTGDEQFVLSCGVVNVNFDRWPDIICDFHTADLEFELTDDTGELEAETIDGNHISQTDDVMVIDTRRPPSRIGSEGRDVGVSLKSLMFGARLVVRASGIELGSLQLEVFSSAGERIYIAQTDGALLGWSLRSANKPVANGVYFYLISVLNENGKVIATELKKFVVMR